LLAQRILSRQPQFKAIGFAGGRLLIIQKEFDP